MRTARASVIAAHQPDASLGLKKTAPEFALGSPCEIKRAGHADRLVWWFASPHHFAARFFADLRTKNTLEL
jgi:hypothetical protein